MLFVDTSFWIALESSSDQYHTHASSYWLEFQQHPQQLVVMTNLKIDTALSFDKHFDQFGFAKLPKTD